MISIALAAADDDRPARGFRQELISGDDPAAATPSRPLSDVDQRMLALERRWWRQAGAKDEAIRAQFNLSPTKYYQALNRLIDSPAALAADPVTVARLRRGRAALVHRRWSR